MNFIEEALPSRARRVWDFFENLEKFRDLEIMETWKIIVLFVVFRATMQFLVPQLKKLFGGSGAGVGFWSEESEWA